MKLNCIICSLMIVLSINLSAQTSIKTNYEDVSLKKEIIIKEAINRSSEGPVNPTQICVDSKGNIFVLESNDNCVKKYSKDGSYLKSFGRKGSGPGELQSCFLMKMDHSDNIYLYDERRKKIIKYSNDGKFLSEMTLSVFIDAFYTASGGEIYLESTKQEEKDTKLKDRLNILSVFSKNLSNQKKIDSCRIKDFKRLENPSVRINLPFASKILWGVSRNSVYVVFTGQYKVVSYTKDGKYIKYFNGQAKQIRISEKDKEEYFKSLTYTNGSVSSSISTVPVWLKKEAEFPLYKPMVCEFLVDCDGYMLIKTAEEIDKKNVWDVYKPDGTIIKKALICSATADGKSFYRNGYLYAIITGAGGLVSVERYPVNIK